MPTRDPLPLYLLSISIHGLIRGDDLELGRDADTGGQTKYVVDLARALAESEQVDRVDLITRRVVSADVAADYGRAEERLSDKARIVRIEAGPDEYIPKEQLWDHLDAFTDNLVDWLNAQQRRPDIIHAHYADAGYVGVRLSNITGVPLVFTGHSLGRDKRHRLLAAGLRREEIEQRYNISRRIEAEEEVLANAALVVTSTHNEVEDQYEVYDYYDPECMAVIPPGTDLEKFHPPEDAEPRIPFARSLARFLNKPEKPFVLALSRPDERKNIATLLEAYGESPKLQKIANLVIVAGNREDIREMDSGAQTVLKDLLLLVDYYDLYGKVAIPKHHQPQEVPDIYRLAALRGGLFINPALTEPFGLTLLEAAASGVPVVATENGGPVDIIGNCGNGLLVDPLDKDEITGALLRLLRDRSEWEKFARNGIQGVRRHYSWQAHAETYLSRIRPLLGERRVLHRKPTTRRPMLYHDRAIFTDVDQSLLGDPAALKDFVRLVRGNRKCASFGIATGRRLDSALAVLSRYNIPLPDVLLTSLGTEIYYAPQLTADKGWSAHVDHHWNPHRVCRVLDELSGLVPQRKHEQSRFKVSYHYDPTIAPSIEEINALLRHQELAVNVVHAFGQFLDIIPVRASKGLALRYFAQRWEIPLEHILVAGGSGADEDMIRGNTLAVVVANRHHEELSGLVEQDRVYFARQPYAAGIIEAVDHYDFYASCSVPAEDV
ncbi:MAG: HAD-IIB family hydrolase [Gammaproteobacteria bacterium]|jgi:sucrose-phosphate synthase